MRANRITLRYNQSCPPPLAQPALLLYSMILNWKVVARGGLDYSFYLSAGIKVTSLITLWLQLRLVTLPEPFLCLSLVNEDRYDAYKNAIQRGFYERKERP